MKWLLVLLMAGIIVSADQVYADNFRCPNENIVSTGDSISKVASKCDTPDSTFKREEPMTVVDSNADGNPRNRIIYIEVQEWTYNQSFSHTLVFRNGVLSEVRFGGFTK